MQGREQGKSRISSINTGPTGNPVSYLCLLTVVITKRYYKNLVPRAGFESAIRSTLLMRSQPGLQLHPTCRVLSQAELPRRPRHKRLCNWHAIKTFSLLLVTVVAERKFLGGSGRPLACGPVDQPGMSITRLRLNRPLGTLQQPAMRKDS